MATMISEVYDAFRAAGVSEEQSRKAAEALAGYENRVGKRDLELAVLTGKVTLLQGMLGVNLAFSVAILWRLMQ
jgi:hypothetical protein